MKTGLFMLLAALLPTHVFACAACYGANVDTSMTEGMNWGIFTLMGVIVTVLASIVTFFVLIIRKAQALAAKAETTTKPAHV